MINKRKEILKNYHHKVKNAEVRKHQRHHNIIEKKRELEKIRQENFILNNIREQRKLTNKKIIVIENGNK